MSTINDPKLGPASDVTLLPESLPQPPAQQNVVTDTPISHVAPDEVMLRVDTLLSRAGFKRLPDGRLTIRDTSAVAGTSSAEGFSSSKQLLGISGIELRPPALPKIEINAELRAGAMAFASHLDTALNDFMIRPLLTSGAATTNTTAAAVGNPAVGNPADGNNSPLGSGTGVDASLPRTANGIPVDMANMRGVSELSSDMLLAAFLKLNITDPNNSVETHNKLYELATKLRQLAIKEAKKRIERAQEMMKEAQKYAEKAEYIGQAVSVLSLVISVAMIAVTFGVATPAVAAAQAATEAAVEAATTAAVEAATTAAVEAATTAATEAATASAQSAADAAVQSLVDEIGAETLANMSEAEIQALVQEISQDMARDMGQQMAQSMAEKLGEQMTEKFATKFSEEFSKQFAQKFSQRFADQLSQKIGTKISAQMVEKSFTETFSKTFQYTFNGVAKEGASSVLINNISSTLSKITTNSNVRLLAVGAQAGLEVVSAGAQMTAAQKMLDAQEQSIQAKRARMRAEMHQQQIEEESEIMRTIMESKNQTVDAVIKMMNAMFASSQKLMSAGMAR